MITEKDAIDLINLAESLGITVFLDGGWGVDALLGRQTREHQDIDLFVEETQAARFIRALHQQGFKERTEAYSTPQHIVFADADGRTVDLHLFTYTSDGEIVFEGETYPADTFSGEGCIGEKKVSCIPRRRRSLSIQDTFSMKTMSKTCLPCATVSTSPFQTNICLI